MRCPAKLVEPWCWEYIRLYGAWTQGRAMTALVLADEPALLLEAMAVIDATVTDLRREESERNESAQVRPGGVKAAAAVRPSTGPRAKRRRRRG